MAAGLGVTPRQVRALLARLRGSGVEVRERRRGRRKVFWIDASPPLDPGLSLTDDDRFILLLACRLAAEALEPTPLARRARLLGERLEALAEPDSFEPFLLGEQWSFGGQPVAELDAGVFETLHHAIRDGVEVLIDYRRANGAVRRQKRVEPYALALRGSTWLLVGRDVKSGHVPNFTVASITACAPTGRCATRPADFDVQAHFADSLSAFTGQEVEVVRLRVAPEAAASFRRKRYHRTQLIEQEGDELVVSFEVAGLDEIAAFVRSFGPRVEVLDPPALRARIAAEARATQMLYGAESQDTRKAEA